MAVLTISPRSSRARNLAGGYTATFTPSFIFVRSDGALQNVFLGEVEESRLRQELDSLLQ